MVKIRTSIRTSITLAMSVAALLVPAAGAGAAPSCVAVVTTFEAHLYPGFVGEEVSGFATAGGHELSLHVTDLSHKHLAGPAECVGGEE